MATYYRKPDIAPMTDDYNDPGDYNLKLEYPKPTEFTMHPIAFITDPTFNSSRGVRHVISNVYGQMDSRISPRCVNKYPVLYGYSERNDWIIENYLKEYRVPEKRICHFKYLTDKEFSTKHGTATFMRRYIVQQYLSLLAFEPIEVYLFRDNPRSSFTQPLVNKLIHMRIPVYQINSRDEREMVDFKTRILYKGDSAFIKIKH